MTIGNVRPRAQDLFQRMAAGRLYQAAYDRGMNLSAFVELEDPSHEYKDGLDAFERMLKVAGIVTRSDPGLGFWSDTFEAFSRDENTRALVPEWAARVWRRVSSGHASTRALYASSDAAAGSVSHPFADAAAARTTQLAPAIPLATLVAVTTPIDSDAYRATYLVDDAAQSRLVRIAQGAELPRAKLVTSDRTIRIYKYGRALETTYETLRRQRIDMVALHIARMAIQAETDKVAALIDVMINGDGNVGTSAENYNLTALDPATTANTLTLRAWLAFKFKFNNPYALTAVLVQEASALSLMLLTTGNANVPLVTIQAPAGFGGFRPLNPGLADNVALGVTTDAPSGRIVGVDTRFAIERVTEIGSNISEVQRYVTRQTEAITLSEVEGYAKLDAKATKNLNLAA